MHSFEGLSTTGQTTDPSGQAIRVRIAQEKGIDIRIALDVTRLAFHSKFDVAIIFSQDQDLSEVADEIRFVAKRDKRFIKVASAYPMPESGVKPRGINRTDWIPIDKETYDACMDPKDYRSKEAV